MNPPTPSSEQEKVTSDKSESSCGRLTKAFPLSTPIFWLADILWQTFLFSFLLLTDWSKRCRTLRILPISSKIARNVHHAVSTRTLSVSVEAFIRQNDGPKRLDVSPAPPDDGWALSIPTRSALDVSSRATSPDGRLRRLLLSRQQQSTEFEKNFK